MVSEHFRILGCECMKLVVWLSEYEPVALLLFSLAAFFLCLTHAADLPPTSTAPLSKRNSFFSIVIAILRLVPDVTSYIEWEKGKVVDKLQSSMKSGRENWRTELPRGGLGIGAIEKLKFKKSKDVQWKGRCQPRSSWLCQPQACCLQNRKEIAATVNNRSGQ